MRNLKSQLIATIVRILSTWGGTSSGELQLEASPLINAMGGMVQLAERYEVDGVTAITYGKNDEEVDETHIRYEDLEESTLQEILTIVQDYEADQIQTEKESHK